MAQHIPVLLEEAINGLKIEKNGVYVDGTFGEGGHSKYILKELGEEGKLFAFDHDPDAGEKETERNKNLFLIRKNFKYMKNYLKYHQAIPVKGILVDLGLSSFQLNKSDRGFSYKTNDELDMRMNPNLEKKARDILLKYSEDDLTNIFKKYGELKNGKKIARRITEKREEIDITKTKGLLKTINDLIPRGKNRNKSLSKLFQSLRIEVNDELSALKKFLRDSSYVLEKGGRLVAISY
ncbi:MAG: 16S rRNA (cytosine(1402)-N(4))-methyltransferase RsmH, partial [Flavobacteriales bacterium]